MNLDFTKLYLTVIEEVAEDGELTNKEIYKLAKWLNENKDGRKSWPACEFFPLLKDVFADGKLEKFEAMQVARLIQKVRRDWAREHSLADAAPSDNSVEDEIKFNDIEPKLPSIPMKLNVASFSEPEMIYEVDFSTPSCGCPDFRTHRHQLSISHISRCCKHIMQGYSEIRPSTGWPSWLEPFLEAGYRPLPNQKWLVRTVNGCNYLISSASPEWGNVYVTIDGESLKFGYSIVDDRWSYGNEPDGADTLARAVCSISK